MGEQNPCRGKEKYGQKVGLRSKKRTERIGLEGGSMRKENMSHRDENMIKRSKEGKDKEKEMVRIIEETRILAAKFFCVLDHKPH